MIRYLPTYCRPLASWQEDSWEFLMSRIIALTVRFAFINGEVTYVLPVPVERMNNNRDGALCNQVEQERIL
jgi:hypothetical protein